MFRRAWFSKSFDDGSHPAAPAAELLVLEERQLLSANSLSKLGQDLAARQATNPNANSRVEVQIFGATQSAELAGLGFTQYLASADRRLGSVPIASLDEIANLNSVTTIRQVEQPLSADRWLVQVQGGVSPDTVAATLGVRASDVVAAPRLQNAYLVNLTNDAPEVALPLLSSTAIVTSYTPLAARSYEKRAIPNDTLFFDQWHLLNFGQTQTGTAGNDANITSVWDTYRGRNVTIGVVDDGVQSTHPDLVANYVADQSFDFNDNDNDASPNVNFDFHGTAVAGVAAGRGFNGVGVSGAAPEALIAGLRLIAAPTTDEQEADALSWKNQDIEIYSNSWGPSDTGSQLVGPGALTLAAFEDSVRNGRGGLGSIYVWAGGNGKQSLDNVNYDGYANSRYTIAVAAIDDDGVQSFYSEPGAALLISAYSQGHVTGITTTDLVGANGYDASDYTDTFGGTSSATPLVSGVIALMLEANPNLSYRDVQHILVNSARWNDQADPDWKTNGAGLRINHKYGFGAIDAAAAVNLARSWQTVKAETRISVPVQNIGVTIPDNSGVGVSRSVTVTQNMNVEWAEVTFDATHSYRGDLEVTLISPEGTESVLAERHNDFNADYRQWKFTTSRNWDERSVGEWTLRVRDLATGDVGTFNNWKLDLYGTTDGPVVDVRAGNVILTDNTSTFSFETTRVGVPVDRTITVRNNGGLNLMLQPATVPAGYSIVTNFVRDQILRSGETATLRVRLNAASPGTIGGQLSFFTSDSPANPFNFNLTGTVTRPGVVVIDDASPGFSTTGTWTGTSGGREGDVRYAAAGNGSAVASWTFNGLTAGSYRIATTWPAAANRATNAPYRVRQTAGGANLLTRAFNQRVAPVGISDLGTTWQDLGTVTISGSSLVVQLTNLANGFVMADAVRIERVNVAIIDDGSAGFSTQGAWVGTAGGRHGDIRYAAAGNGSAVATWSFAGLSAGQYRVAATWAAATNRATNAPFRVRQTANGTNLLTTVVNQRNAPVGIADQGSVWQSLGIASITGSTLVVQLTNAANGYVIADAIRLERVGAPPNPVSITAPSGSTDFRTGIAPLVTLPTAKRSGNAVVAGLDRPSAPLLAPTSAEVERWFAEGAEVDVLLGAGV